MRKWNKLTSENFSCYKQRSVSRRNLKIPLDFDRPACCAQNFAVNKPELSGNKKNFTFTFCRPFFFNRYWHMSCCTLFFWEENWWRYPKCRKIYSCTWGSVIAMETWKVGNISYLFSSFCLKKGSELSKWLDKDFQSLRNCDKTWVGYHQIFLKISRLSKVKFHNLYEKNWLASF